MSVVLIVKWIAEDGKQDEIAEILRLMRPLTRQEPGCVSYDVYRSTEDPHDFMLVELYQDQAAVTAHTEADYFRRYILERALPALKHRERAMYSVLD
jgi:quinol monooxygenase YgiN